MGTNQHSNPSRTLLVRDSQRGPIIKHMLAGVLSMVSIWIRDGDGGFFSLLSDQELA
jgi:hypothetical protein